MSECTHDCSTCSQSCGNRIEPESLLAKPHELSHIKKVVGVCSGKGGVGKSLVTSLLAVLAQRQGLKVGILDADITGPSIPKAFGIKEKAMGTDAGILPVKTKTGLDVMSLNLLLDNDVIWGDKDVLFIDMPPGTGDVMLTVFQTIPVDGVILVSTPQELVEMIVEKALKMAGMMEIPVMALVENMSYVACPDCGKHVELFGKSHVAEIAQRYNIPLTAQLPIDPKLAGGIDKGMIELFNGDWLDKIADAVYELPARAAR